MEASLVKAAIINLDKAGTQIPCMFNPSKYSFTKQNSWTRSARTGANLPEIEFSNGSPATLVLDLFFDTYSTREDVRQKYTDAIWQLMLVDDSLRDEKSGKARPPRVRFQWGRAWTFDAVLTQLTQTFSLFLEDGTPVRAMLSVTFQQIVDDTLYPKQNPTSGGKGGERLWTVQPGDSLAWIAYREYGNSNKWRLIADANRMSRVRELIPGRVLVIPHG